MARKPRILVADDDAKLIEALKLRLESLNCEVVTAHDGYTALAKATCEQPDLLILDINMPAGDGFSVQERLDKAYGTGGPPVIYLTGDKSPRLDEIAENLGACAIFHKPFNTGELVETIYDVLRPKAA